MAARSAFARAARAFVRPVAGVVARHGVPLLAGAAFVGGVAYSTGMSQAQMKVKPSVQSPAFYQTVYNDVAELLDDLDHDDGSWGPIFVRLAWHAAGTYDKVTHTGGSNGATMRYAAEAKHGANAGLQLARERLEAVKRRHPEISYADLWSLAGVVAIQEMGGPTIPWRGGRVDASLESACPPDGRLPDASKKSGHLREVFYRMGFNDQDIVALSGAHALGRCHTDRSGFSGPWTFAPTTFSNEYFVKLLGETWVPKQWAGPKQFQDAKTGELMMLPSDLALVEDAKMKPWVEAYAKDQARFFADFAAAFGKLLELGVPFPAEAKPIELKRA